MQPRGAAADQRRLPCSDAEAFSAALVEGAVDRLVRLAAEPEEFA